MFLSDNTTKFSDEEARLFKSGLSLAALSLRGEDSLAKLKLSPCLRGDVGPGERSSSPPDFPSNAAIASATLSVLRLVSPGLSGVSIFSTVLPVMAGGGAGNSSEEEDRSSCVDGGGGGSDEVRAGTGTWGDRGGYNGGGGKFPMSENSGGGKGTSAVVAAVYLAEWPFVAVTTEGGAGPSTVCSC